MDYTNHTVGVHSSAYKSSHSQHVPPNFLYAHLTFTIPALMKLIIAGASGFVGTELVRQSLKRPDVSVVVALSRKAVSAPSDAGADASKLRSVVLKDYDEYPEHARKEFEGASGCIWYVHGAVFLFGALTANAGR